VRDVIQLAAARDNPNVKAFLAVIRAGEGTSDPDGYRRHFGGSHFDSFADHPRKVITAGLGKNQYTSSAAGAYQFLTKTWDGLVKRYGFADFEPATQDIAAIALIDGRGALDDVLAGRFEAAVRKCNREWASLPGSPYGQPTKTMAQATKTYLSNGGVLGSAQEAPVAPFIAAALPALIEAAPALIRIFGKGERSEQNAKAAEVVAEIAKEATAQPTVEGAVNALQNDPQAAAAYREAVHQRFSDLVALSIQVSEAEDKSRAAALDRNLTLAKASGGRWLWLLGLVSVLVVIASYVITWRVLFGENVSLSDETKALLIGQIVIFGFAAVLQFLYGSNIQNRINDQKKE
jgi:muramidase (phage lysozyme)